MSKSIVLIDADPLIYRALGQHNHPAVWNESAKTWTIFCGDTIPAEAEMMLAYSDPVSFCVQRLKMTLDGLCNQFSDATRYLFVGVDDNKRHLRHAYPDYNTNRKAAKPAHYNEVREYLLSKSSGFNVIACSTKEADSVLATTLAKTKQTATLVSIDKDLLYLLPGNKYNILNNQSFLVSEEEALLNTLYLLLSGDASDGIKGLRGLGEVKRNDDGGIKENKTTKEVSLVLEEIRNIKTAKTKREEFIRYLQRYLDKDATNLVNLYLGVAKLILDKYLPGLQWLEHWDWIMLRLRLIQNDMYINKRIARYEDLISQSLFSNKYN